MPARADVVVLADRLALQSARAEGAEAGRLALEAGRLRERIWRLEGREVDALEARELYRAAAEADWNGACDAALDLASLEGEVEGDARAVYTSAYMLRYREPGSACARAADALLETVSAFEPPASELATLRRRAARSRGAPADGGSEASLRDEARQGPVIVPRVVDRPRAEPARITKVEQYPGKDAARVVVFVTHPALFEVGSLAGSTARGPRLFVDIQGAEYDGPTAMNGEGLVERVRLGEHERRTRVVLDLAEPVYRKIFYLPEPFRLVVDVSKEPPDVVEPRPKGPRDVHRVVLDPGHGGEDPGAIGARGLREKDVVLDVAHRAAPLIARELGISALLTRDADVFVPLDERVARANAFGADLFVSIHCNASEDPSTHGVTTFVLDASRDDLAARVAARENAASPAAAAELANVMSQVLDSASIARSTHFAELLQRSAVASVAPRYDGVSDLGVRRAGFYVLAGARMPAALFETSFISHPVEEQRLDTGQYRQKIADAIVNAVRAYRDGI